MNDPISSMKIEIEMVDHSVLDTKWKSTGQINPNAKLYFIEEGSGTLEHNGQRFILRPNRSYLIPSNARHTYSCDKRIVISWLHFKARLFDHIDISDYFTCRFEFSDTGRDETLRLHKRLSNIYQSGTPAHMVESAGIVQLLIAPFIVTKKEIPDKNISRFNIVLQHIHSNISSPLYIPELAKIMNMETSYFATSFKDRFGMPPARFITKKRIELTQELLKRTTQKLEVIAAQTGFCDSFHLSKTFKKMTGISPADYRTKHSRTRIQP